MLYSIKKKQRTDTIRYKNDIRSKIAVQRVDGRRFDRGPCQIWRGTLATDVRHHDEQKDTSFVAANIEYLIARHVDTARLFVLALLGASTR